MLKCENLQSILVPDEEYEGNGHQDSVCPSLLLMLVVVWHSSVLQEDVDTEVDDGDHHQGEDELEHSGEDCEPDQNINK